MTDPIIVRAAEIYAELKGRGELISDADILIAATALVHGLLLITKQRGALPAYPGPASPDLERALNPFADKKLRMI